MNMRPSKRKYRSSLEFVEAGFRACLQNAQDLVSASQKLIAAELHAPALSVAGLALEELGKLFALDGLLYARPDDHKAEAFTKAGRGHSTKLDILVRLPLLLGHLGKADPRYGKERAYDEALAISLVQLKDDGNAVFNRLQTKTFAELDRWKQKGFYSEVINDLSFLLVMPSTLISQIPCTIWPGGPRVRWTFF